MKFTFQPKKNNIAALFFIVAMLLSAQASSLVHGVDHFQHEKHELCESFLVFDYSSSIVDSVQQAIFELSASSIEPPTIDAPSQRCSLHYSIRAPPFSYS